MGPRLLQPGAQVMGVCHIMGVFCDGAAGTAGAAQWAGAGGRVAEGLSQSQMGPETPCCPRAEAGGRAGLQLGVPHARAHTSVCACTAACMCPCTCAWAHAREGVNTYTHHHACMHTTDTHREHMCHTHACALPATCMHPYTHMHMQAHVHTRLCKCVCAHACTHTRMPAHVHAGTCAHGHMCSRVPTCTHVCTHCSV